jgi:hypothetical protein
MNLPLSEILKSIPGFFGIRLEEQPVYDVVQEAGPDGVEVRRYAPALLAEVTVSGDHDRALDEGFERLARYIFGENEERERMHMTVPVLQSEGVRARASGNGAWTVSFFLSNDLTKCEAPVPKDAGVRLVTAPARLVAVTHFSGNNDEEGRVESRERLLQWLSRQNIYGSDGIVYWAQYDAPFVIPFLKKNEAQLELRLLH